LGLAYQKNDGGEGRVGIGGDGRREEGRGGEVRGREGREKTKNRLRASPPLE